MECVRYCIICQQPFKLNNCIAFYNVNLKSERHRMRTCSPICDQSLHYSLGLTHGFILFHILHHLCGDVRWKQLSVSASSIRKPWNNLCTKASEDGCSDTEVKRELQYIEHVEDDVSEMKVFFDQDDVSDNEQEFMSLCEESSEKDNVGLHRNTHPQACNTSVVENDCISMVHSSDSTQTLKAETKSQTQCHFCHSSFSPGDQQGLAGHMCEVHTKEIHLDIICDVCGALFKDIEVLRQHKKKIHCIHLARDGSDRIDNYTCEKCLQTFSAHSFLQKHNQSCHSSSSFKHSSSSSKQTHTKHRMRRKTFKTKDNLNSQTNCECKLGETEEGKRYQCHRCNKEYPTKLRMQRHHQFVHSQQTPVECTVCGKFFRNKLLLKHHTQFMHSKQTPGNCPMCRKTYRNAHLLKMHTKVVHKVRVITNKTRESSFQCIYCSHTFSVCTQDAITNHLAACHDQKASSHHLSCKICGTAFNKKVYLTRHVKQVHELGAVCIQTECKNKRKNDKKRYPYQNKRESDKKRYPCDKCGKTYTQSALSKHIHIHHTTQEPVDCDICGKTLINLFHLSQHKRQHVPTKICHICGASFKTDAGLRGHLAAHKGTKSHVCEVCGMGFVRKTSWQRHIKLHSETVHLQCDCCPKTFKTVYSLNTHMLAKHHQGVFFHNRIKTLEEVGYVVDKEAINRHLNHQCVVCGKNIGSGACPAHPDNCMLLFKCNYCELVVNHINALCQHLKQHNIPLAFVASTRNFTASWSAKRDDSDMDYTCQVCHKSFQRRENLAGHMKQHKEKAYECHICLKKFTYKCNMKNHLRTHSEDKPFQCELCQKAFKSKQLLTNHRLVHNLSESPFKCQICGKGLTRKFFLQRHYRQMHPGVTV